MTETTARIRWTGLSAGSDPAYTGSVGTVNPSLFQIYAPDFFAPQFILTTSFPGMEDKRSFADDPDELKAEAERWLEEFTSSLGAVFEPAKRESLAVMLLLDHDDGSLVDVVVYEDDLKAESEAQGTAEDTGYRVQVWTGRPVVSGRLTPAAPETSAPKGED